MTTDPEALARQAIAAVEAGDAERLASCFDSDCEFFLPRNNIEGGGYYGHAGLRKAIADIYETWESVRFEVKGVERDADVVIIRARVVNTPRGPRPAVDYDAFYGCRLGERGFS